jgi:hypothetical protein
MADVVTAPSKFTSTDNTNQQPGQMSGVPHWLTSAVHDAQDMGKKALNSSAAKQIKDSGEHIANGVMQRGKNVYGNGKDAASAAGVVAHDAANGKVDPRHIVDAGEKVGATAAKASPHAIVAGAVKDEVLRKVPLSQHSKDVVTRMTDPKKLVLDGAHKQVNEAVKNLPTFTIGGLHPKQSDAANAAGVHAGDKGTTDATGPTEVAQQKHLKN